MDTINPHSPRVQRLSRPFPNRLALVTSTSGVVGFTLGVFHGSATSALRFRAENAHRQPKSKWGWYLYHKTKTWTVVRASLLEGARMAARLALWTGVAIAAEEGVDRGRLRLRGQWEGRERRDAGSTVLAGMATAGAFGMWCQSLLRPGGLAVSILRGQTCNAC